MPHSAHKIAALFYSCIDLFDIQQDFGNNHRIKSDKSRELNTHRKGYSNRENKPFSTEEGHNIVTFNGIMDFNNENTGVFEALKGLLTNKQKAKVVPFVGAGLSADFGFPTWTAFLKEGFEIKKKKMPEKTSYLVIAEQLRYEMGKDEFYAFVRRKFSRDIDKSKIARKAVSFLPKLFPSLIVTTNFDRLLEQIHPKNPPVAYPQKNGPLLSYALEKENPLIFKIHGSVEIAEDIIFTKDAYDDEYAQETDLVKGLHRCFSEDIFLFLGCSLEQDKPLEIWKEMIPNLKDHIHYAILPCKEEKCTQRREELRKQNINVILYPSGKHDCVRVILKELLRATYPYLRRSGITPFRYDAGTVGFFGRENELEALQAFLTANRAFCWTAITGAGGSGKTRLGYEFAENNVSWWNVPKLGEAYNKEELDRTKANIEGDTLFVLD
ncbi:SIR2 family protein [Candidatus Bathycorpusculum sp.]|uniref:SIR2 family protein n=1 Tax=Candidatus Bathycorpusculum sp. TaxID=2994959 RepID=UPI00281AB6DE|nr:SIR2 family protein [Candidatus Termitimicrobium sp.]